VQAALQRQMTSPLRLSALGAALLAALVLSACGGSSSSSSSESAATLVTQTFSSRQPVHSGQLSLSVNLDLHGSSKFPAPLQIKMAGPFQSNGGGKLPDFDLSMLFGSGGQSFGAGLTATGGKAYVTFAGQAYVMPNQTYQSLEQDWVQRQSSSTSGGAFGALGIQPSHWLTSPAKVGVAQVGGATTIHITSGVDVSSFLDDVNTLLGKTASLGVASEAGTPSSISPKTRAALSQSVAASHVDIYTGSSDHTLRRLTITVALAVPPAQRKQLDGLTGGTISIDLLISQVNQQQQISTPSGAQPLSALSGLSGLAGGGGTGTGSGSSSAGSGSGGTSAPSAGATGSTLSAPKAYLDCLKKAGNNLQAVQSCASLLNGG
jgi:hypothetical protein